MLITQKQLENVQFTQAYNWKNYPVLLNIFEKTRSKTHKSRCIRYNRLLIKDLYIAIMKANSRQNAVQTNAEERCIVFLRQCNVIDLCTVIFFFRCKMYAVLDYIIVHQFPVVDMCTHAKIIHFRRVSRKLWKRYMLLSHLFDPETCLKAFMQTGWSRLLRFYTKNMYTLTTRNVFGVASQPLPAYKKVRNIRTSGNTRRVVRQFLEETMFYY